MSKFQHGNGAQLSLKFEDSGATDSATADSGFLDPKFASNKIKPIHRWVPWIAGFSAEFVSDILERFLPERDGIVLDPFAGVGTTLLESVFKGHQCTGFEINPYASFASQIKLSSLVLDERELSDHADSFYSEYVARVNAGVKPKSQPPSGFHTKIEFYSPNVLTKVLTALDIVGEIENTAIKNLMKLAFAATMVTYSNYSYEPSLSRKSTAGKKDVTDYDVGSEIFRKVDEMRQDIGWLRDSHPQLKPSYRVIEGSFFDYSHYLESEYADLVITSPPYMNNYHYNRNTRPQTYWLEMVSSPKDFRPLEQASFGKFWQTVRAEKPIELSSSILISSLGHQIEAIRSLNPEKGVYGGSGWANYVATYFNDCHRFAKALSNVLRPNGTAIVVIGNSVIQGTMIPTDQYFGEIAQSVGLELVNIAIPRATRVGNSIIQSNVRVRKAQKHIRLYEAVVELRKP